MTSDPLATATDAMRSLFNNRIRPRSWLEAAFAVSESLSDEDAKAVLVQLCRQGFLAQPDADLAQLLAQRLGVPVQWSHARFSGDGEWMEGRGEP